MLVRAAIRREPCDIARKALTFLDASDTAIRHETVTKFQILKHALGAQIAAKKPAFYGLFRDMQAFIFLPACCFAFGYAFDDALRKVTAPLCNALDQSRIVRMIDEH